MDHQSLTADHPVRQVFRFIESQGESPEALSADGLDERFNELALALFEFQFAQNPPLRRWCENRGAHPQKIDHWTQIPAMPTTAFREMELSCIQPDQRSVSFHSSGTTGHQPSRHFHSAASLQLYDASLKPWFRRHLLPNWQPSVADEGGKLRMRPQILSLTPPPAAAPNSSLVHMFEVVRQEFGDAHSVFAGSVDVDGGWSFAPEEVAGWLQRHTVLNHPVIFCGTAFNFVQLIDWMISRDECINLPPGSALMETGGYKGRSRRLPRHELHQILGERLGLPDDRIVCEYGMCELSSQAYDRIAGSPNSARKLRFPPWARARIVSAENAVEVSAGRAGLIQVFDLANAFSAVAIQTEDLGIWDEDGFELIGRATEAIPRGCSLMSV